MTWLIREVERPDQHTQRDILGKWRTFTPGLLLAAALGFGGYLLQEAEAKVVGHRVIEALVFAMILGLVVRNLFHPSEVILPGSTYASKTVLELAVVILGASVDIEQVLNAGALLLVAITAAVLLGMVMSFSLGKAFGLGSRIAYLVAVGNSICGNAAIAAIAPVIRA